MSIVRVEHEDALSLITLNRPEKLNALSRALLDELAQALEAIRGRAQTRAIILTGAGEKAFVAGADIAELAELSPLEARAAAARGQALFDAIESSPKPVIAAINGFALGGGLELALACNLRLAAEGARFGQPEVKLGLIPGYGGTQRLPRLVGLGKALELVMTGEMIDAAEALRIGLVNAVAPRGELLERARALARKLCDKAPVALRLAREAVLRGRGMSQAQGLALEAELFGLCFATQDLREGTRAFIEKRTPEFRDA